ncbi:MAG: polysaccharide biosynthesis/export family protein, partial [Acidobacteriia bacterium]|nr:polysaccharide biosynthesis/export family protein [Terriglobia bacterium]
MTQAGRIATMAVFALCGIAADNSNGKPQSEVIGPADTLSILVLDSDELSKSWRVNATGDVNLPLVGRMDAAGLTVEQFQQDLVQRLRKYYWNPEVTVYIAEFRSQPITVTGSVEKPGTIQLENSRTLFEALMRAGGPKDAGDKVTLTRELARGRIAWPGAKQQDETYSVATLSLKNVMDGRSPEANIPVQAHDVIAVAAGKEQRLVYIIGGVNKPGAVELV